MSKNITSIARDLVQSARAENKIVDVAEIAQQVHRSFPSYAIGELKNIVFEQAVATGANARWE